VTVVVGSYSIVRTKVVENWAMRDCVCEKLVVCEDCGCGKLVVCKDWVGGNRSCVKTGLGETGRV
jgi:hypothetical protein